MNHLRLVYSRPKVTPYLVTMADIGLGMVLWAAAVTMIVVMSLKQALPRDE